MSDESPVVWTGRIDRGEQEGTIVGKISDRWGWEVYLTGKRDPNGSGYLIEGTLGPVPAVLKVALVDDPIAGKG